MPMRRLWNAIAKRQPVQDSPERERSGPSSSLGGKAAGRIVVSSASHVCAISDVGRVRDHNEDAFHVSPTGDWFVVADGMGGHEAGEVAAGLAIQAIVERLARASLETTDPAEAASRLLEAVAGAHSAVHEVNRRRAPGSEMGCTLAVCHVADELVTYHVGDVRCYLLRGGALRQVTRDHSTVAALVEAGRLTAEEARVQASKNEVLQAIGMPAGVRPEITRADVAPGDRVLLCSDGLWEALCHDDIQSIVASDGTVRQLATQLVDRANSAGGHDNITVVLYEIPPAMDPAPAGQWA
jgi:protein phosphatase